jgi:protein-S-isoprenylcysteine O-methyltransferase Ste14
MATNSDQPPEPIDRRRMVLSTGLSLVFIMLSLFLPAGTWTWLRGWLFLVVLVAASILITVYLQRVNPDVVAARVNRHNGTKRWDLLLGMIFILPTILAIPIVAALDDGRYHWFPVPWWGCVLGYVLLVIGMVGVTWAESVNKFFEPSVRIQTDRGHHVIDTGPYAIVRHPGYVSGFFFIIGMPLCLGSLWAMIPAVLFCLLLVVRTIWEDQTLRKELVGYEAGPARTLGSLGGLGCLRPDRFIGIPFSVLLTSRQCMENNRWRTVGIFPWMRSYCILRSWRILAPPLICAIRWSA